VAVVVFHQDFSIPASKLYRFFDTHAKTGQVLGVNMTCIQYAGEGEPPEGVGSVRAIRPAPGLPAFEETITEAVPGKRIAYRISRGSPFRNYEASIDFSDRPQGSRLEYQIRLESHLKPLDALVARGLRFKFGRGLKKLAAHCE
jgi:hypothetical protein